MCVNFPQGIFDSTQQSILVHSFRGLRSWSLDLCTWAQHWGGKIVCQRKLSCQTGHYCSSQGPQPNETVNAFFFSPGRTKRYQDTQVPNPSCLSPPAVSRTSKLVLLRMGDRKAKGRHSSLQGKFPIQTIIGCASNQKQQPINMSLRRSNSPSIKVMRSTEQRCFSTYCQKLTRAADSQCRQVG